MINIVSFRDESTAYTDDTRVRRHIFNNSNIVKPAKSFEKILLGDFFFNLPIFFLFTLRKRHYISQKSIWNSS